MRVLTYSLCIYFRPYWIADWHVQAAVHTVDGTVAGASHRSEQNASAWEGGVDSKSLFLFFSTDERPYGSQ